MKNHLLGIFFLTLSFALSAQITVTNATFPQAGDTLRTAIDGAPNGIDINPAGGTTDQSWDFTNLLGVATERVYRPASEGTNFAAFPSADIFSTLGPTGETYYDLMDDGMVLVGYEGPDPANLGLSLTVKLDPTLRERRAPLNFIDNYSDESAILLSFASDDLPAAVLDSLDETPDSIRLRIAIDRNGIVDGWGTAKIPGGTYDILREKIVEERDTRLEIKVSIGPISSWIDVTSAVPFFDFVGKDTVTTYTFWNDEEKEPIALVTVDNEDNDQVLLVEYKYVDLSTNTTYINRGRPDLVANPNPAIDEVRFNFLNLDSGQYTLKVYNILGVVIWEKQYRVSGNRTEKIDLSNFRKGTYLYSLVNENGKTITTKRLMVMRP